MNPQDRTAVRTASDIERKYNLKGMTKQVEMQKDNLYKLEYNLTNFANSVTKDLVNLQDQVDGNITTWFSNGEPSLESYPASEWLEEQKNTHLGDLYYDSNTGYSYRFAFENEQYHWIKLTDSDVTKALAMANSAQDTADSKRRIFLETPSVPYDNGDMWIKDQEIYICQISKDENQTFDENDFIVATKYTDNTLANQVNDRITVVAGQVTTIEQNVSKISAEMQDAKYYVDEEGNKILITNQINKLSATAYGLNQITESAGGNNIFRNAGLWFTENKTHIEETTTNLFENKTYSYCQKRGDGPVYSENTLDYTFPMQEETSDMFVTNHDEIIPVEGNAKYKYTYLNTLSRYDLLVYELDEDKKLIADPFDTSVAKGTELTYGTDKEITFDANTKYIFLLGSKNDDDSSATLEEMQEQLSSIQLIETKDVEVSEEAYEFWEGIAGQGTNDNATNYRSILLQNSIFSQEQEVPNGNYSISFYYQKLIELANASVAINDIEYPLDSLEVKQFYTGEQDSETGEYIVDPIVVSNGHIKIEFKCDTNDGVEVYDLMCNKGSVKLAYSQNQNETTTDTVNISKGITITSSADENTKFKADYDGIRVLDKSNTVKTKFTDKGTETDELLVRRKATITSLLHQEVDDQAWVTKI